MGAWKQAKVNSHYAVFKVSFKPNQSETIQKRQVNSLHLGKGLIQQGKTIIISIYAPIFIKHTTG